MASSIALVCIATGKYDQFVKPLLESAAKYFPAHVPFLWTDSKEEFVENQFFLEHKGWPDATLLRYHVFLTQQHKLEEFDYLWYSDVDMKFVAKVESEEILATGITATIHPGQIGGPGVPERNSQSTAYIPDGTPSKYFAGGFIGGSSKSFLDMAHVISKMIDADRAHGILARENDESYMNAYLWANPPAKILSPEYCWPDIPPPSEFSRRWEKVGFNGKPKLLALEKNRSRL